MFNFFSAESIGEIWLRKGNSYIRENLYKINSQEYWLYHEENDSLGIKFHYFSRLSSEEVREWECNKLKIN